LSFALAGCGDEITLAPSDATIIIQVRTDPPDPRIVLRGHIQSNGRVSSEDIPSGSEFRFGNLGVGFSIFAFVNQLEKYACHDLRDPQTQLGTVSRLIDTQSGADHYLTTRLLCRSATLDMNVTGLPGGESATIDFVSSGAPPRGDTSYVRSGRTHVAVYPSTSVSVQPRVVIVGGTAYQAATQVLNAASVDTTALTIAYSVVANALGLAVDPAMLTMAPGTSAPTTVSIARGALPLGDVTLDLVNPPAGVSAQFSPNPVSGNTSTATITAQSFVGEGITPITVRATAGGVTQTATLTLDIQRPDFTMTASRLALTVAPGDTGSVDLSFIRNATAVGPIALSRSAPPADVSAAFDATSVAGNGARLTFKVTATAASINPTPIVVTASLGGVTRTLTVTLTVPAPTSSFGISMPSTATVEQGLGLSVPITMTRGGSFVNAGIVLTASAPTMAGHEEVWIAPATAMGDAAQLEVSTNVSSTLRTHRVTVTATRAGMGVVGTAFVDVTVGARTGADFAIVPQQKAISVVHGQIGRVNLSIYRYAGFTSSITLSTPGAPANTLSTFTPPTVDNLTATAELQFYVSPMAVPGTYALVIEGTGQNGVKRRTAVSLVVAPTP
jgi:hypothetical protein